MLDAAPEPPLLPDEDTDSNRFEQERRSEQISPWSTDLGPWIPWIFYRLTSAGNSEGRIERYNLRQNYPNPFNPSTTIQYGVRQPSHIELNIYDSLGRLIKSVVDEFKSSGEYAVVWDGKVNFGKPVPSGVYSYRIKTGELIATKKMVCIK